MPEFIYRATVIGFHPDGTKRTVDSSEEREIGYRRFPNVDLAIEVVHDYVRACLVTWEESAYPPNKFMVEQYFRVKFEDGREKSEFVGSPKFKSAEKALIYAQNTAKRKLDAFAALERPA